MMKKTYHFKRTTMDALDYTLTRGELIAVKAYIMFKLEKAIRRNQTKPSQELADLMHELQEIIEKLDRCLAMFDEQQKETREAKKQLFHYKSEVEKLVKERDELLIKTAELEKGL